MVAGSFILLRSKVTMTKSPQTAALIDENFVCRKMGGGIGCLGARPSQRPKRDIR